MVDIAFVAFVICWLTHVEYCWCSYVACVWWRLMLHLRCHCSFAGLVWMHMLVANVFPHIYIRMYKYTCAILTCVLHIFCQGVDIVGSFMKKNGIWIRLQILSVYLPQTCRHDIHMYMLMYLIIFTATTTSAKWLPATPAVASYSFSHKARI